MNVKDIFVKDRLVGVFIGLVAFILLILWPFDGVHPSAWEDIAVSAGIIPTDRVMPGLGRLIAHAFFAVLPTCAAVFTTVLLAKAVVALCGFLAYGVFVRLLRLLTLGGTRDRRRRHLASRIAAITAAFAFVCSEPMWMVAQGKFDSLVLIFLSVFSAWCMARLMNRPSVRSAVGMVASLGVLSAETPFGWVLLACFVSLLVWFSLRKKSEAWLDFLDPVLLQKTKWSMTFAFLTSFVFTVLIDLLAFAHFDGIRAAGMTAGDLPIAFVRDYCAEATTAFGTTGLILFAAAVFIPLGLTAIQLRTSTDEERFLTFANCVLYVLCGGVSYLQLAPFSAAWFWNIGSVPPVSESILPFSAFLCAYVVASALFVLAVEVLCRDYDHIEGVAYRGLRDDTADPPAPAPSRESVHLTPGRCLALLLPVVLIALVVCGRRLSDDRRLQSLLCRIVDETIEEAVGTKYLMTDGALDFYLLLEARSRGESLSPVSMTGGNSPFASYLRRQAAAGDEDLRTLDVGAAEALRTWVLAKSSRLADVSAQNGFEFFRMDRRLKPVLYGVLARPSGDAQAAAASVARCRKLADEILALHGGGVWRHAKSRLLKDRFLSAQRPFAVLSRQRASRLDAEGRVRESLEETRLADRLDASTPNLAQLARRADWLRRASADRLTPREGLEVAMKRLDFNMARRYAQPILGEDPDEPNANFALGMCFYAQEQYAKAETYLRRVLKREPNEPSVYNNLALIALKAGRLDDAESLTRKAMELKPDQLEIRETLKAVQKAREAQKSSSGPVSAPAPAFRLSAARVGVSSASWQLPFEKVADEMARFGIKGVHLTVDPFLEGGNPRTNDWAFVRAKVASGDWNVLAVRVSAVFEDYTSLASIRATGGIVPDATWETNQMRVARAAHLAKELACPFVSIRAGFLDEENPAAYAKFVERVLWMRDACAEQGVALLLESGQETARTLAKFMPKVPGVGVCFNPADMILYAKGNPLEDVRLLMGWIRLVHLRDACETKTPGTWGTEVKWGEGEVGGSEFLIHLVKLGYEGAFVVERESGDDRAGDLRRTLGELVR